MVIGLGSPFVFGFGTRQVLSGAFLGLPKLSWVALDAKNLKNTLVFQGFHSCWFSVLWSSRSPSGAYRLVVRTTPFHGVNESSILSRDTFYDIIYLYLPNGGTLTYSLERGIKW